MVFWSREHELHEAFSHKEILQCIGAVKLVIGASRISIDRKRVWGFSFTERISCSTILLNILEIRQNEKWRYESLRFFNFYPRNVRGAQMYFTFNTVRFIKRAGLSEMSAFMSVMY